MIRETDEYRECRKLFREGASQVMVHGLSGAQKAVFAALFIEEEIAEAVPDTILGSKVNIDLNDLDEGSSAAWQRCPFLALSANQQSAQRLFEEVSLLLPHRRITFFPALDDLSFEALGQSREIMGERVQVLRRLLDGELDGVVTSGDALLPLLMSPMSMATLPIKVRVGASISLQDTLQRLVQLGYQRSHLVEAPGFFATRGGIIDVFPPADANPLRFELFGEEIDSIRRFSAESQLSLDHLKEATISPARELVLSEEEILKGIAAIKEDMQTMLATLPDQAVRSSIAERSRRLIDTLEAGVVPAEIEHFLPYFVQQGSSLLDYFVTPPLILMDEAIRVQESWEERLNDLSMILGERYLRGELLPRQLQRWYEFSEFQRTVSNMKQLLLSVLPRRPQWLRSLSQINAVARTVPSFQGAVQNLMDEVERWKNHDYAILLLCDGIERGRRLQHTFSEYGLEVNLGFNAPRGPLPGEVLIIHGALQNCFEWPQVRFVLLSDQLLFSKAKRPRREGTIKEGKRLSSYRELIEGDLVVHVNHGIGRFLGVVTMEIENIRRDYLHLQYAGTDKVFVPVDQIGLVQKYLGGGGAEEKAPRLHALNSTEWQRSKQKVQAAIKEMAEELIALYASRQALPGYAFSEDTPWQAEFEELFPYEETPDQLIVIDEVKRDMENSRPMERLLCGDVGYGKTEVAIRAAFKAVLEGKQVAVLAPTTVLVQQHLNTFKERFNQFPVEIAMMSRFRTAKENARVCDQLRSRQVDIVIGTHRLLSKDIQFADLGLLIIDEEQRFGVAQKEKIKQLRQNVDVLMLSATPIPRTLHMAMVGIRDMSIIETPPENRYPVQTYVVEWDDSLVREAIRREINREGQVFLVHNRINDLDYFAEKILQLVPEARIIVGHGQMPEGMLERVMLDFIEGEYNVLISTTIIESGLDMPNVNTLIVHESDRYGLSQLHQLRGRVGRSNRRAYAYFTFQRNRALTEIAEKRLAAIKEFCEFGAGFGIAQRDLELRGVGNLLGPQQHGHVSVIGFELYTQLLEEAVHELRGIVLPPKVETVLELNIEAFLPSSYVPSQAQKIAVYKRIQAAQLAEIDTVENELSDRFGSPPIAVKNLLRVARVRHLAHNAGVASIKQNGRQSVISLYPGVQYPINDAALIVRDMKGSLAHLAGKPSPFIILGEDSQDLLRNLEFFLPRLGNIALR